MRVSEAVVLPNVTTTAEPASARPAEPIVVGLDGGYVRSRHRQDERHFEVIASKVIDAQGSLSGSGVYVTFDVSTLRRYWLCPYRIPVMPSGSGPARHRFAAAFRQAQDSLARVMRRARERRCWRGWWRR
jgi:hypothetical protein